MKDALLLEQLCDGNLRADRAGVIANVSDTKVATKVPDQHSTRISTLTLSPSTQLG